MALVYLSFNNKTAHREEFYRCLPCLMFVEGLHYQLLSEVLTCVYSLSSLLAGARYVNGREKRQSMI
jgi:hypothetical protein